MEFGIENLKDQLEVVVGMRKQMRSIPPGTRFWGNEDLVLQWGTAFTKSPEEPPGKRIPKTCYDSSYKAANRRGGKWVYCEGFGIQRGLSLAMPHAWVARPGDLTDVLPGAHDLAWEDDAVYLGIPFRQEYVRKVRLAPMSRKLNNFAVLDCWWLQWPLLTGEVKVEDVIWRP